MSARQAIDPIRGQAVQLSYDMRRRTGKPIQEGTVLFDRFIARLRRHRTVSIEGSI
jgi:hypothetical protein